MKLLKVYNLATDEVVTYISHEITPTEAVTNMYAVRHDLLHDWQDAFERKDFSAFPIVIGQASVACGDFACKRES